MNEYLLLGAALLQSITTNNSGTNKYLVFNTEAAAQEALGIIYAAMVGAIAAPDLLNVETNQAVPKDDITPSQAVAVDAASRNFPIFGSNAASGVKNVVDGYTTAWAVAQQRVTDNKWVFPEPAESLMADVAGYTVEPYNADWFPANGVSLLNG